MDSPKHHVWKVGQPYPELQLHSLAKHRIIQAYIDKYIEVLTLDHRRDRFKLALVDGFAGGGKYQIIKTKEEKSGSPLLMLDAVKNATTRINSKRRKPIKFDITYYFVEKHKEHYEHLIHVIKNSEYKSLLNNAIRTYNAEYIDVSDSIIKDIASSQKSGRSIFVLDQCGYLDVPIPQIRNILSQLKSSEIILTFSTDFLADYLSTDDSTQLRLKKLGISLPTSAIDTAKKSQDTRRIIQFQLHKEIPQSCGAKHYTPFFIHSPESHKDYWLIHLSGHYRAKDVMLELHWNNATDISFTHYGRSGLNMLGYDPEKDQSVNYGKCLPQFAFDATAKADSQAHLLNEMPELIFNKYRDGISLTQLFDDITDQSPVTLTIMKQVLNDLSLEGEVQVLSKGGKLRAGRKIQESNDIIRPNKQKKLFSRHGK